MIQVKLSNSFFRIKKTTRKKCHVSKILNLILELFYHQNPKQRPDLNKLKILDNFKELKTFS